MDQSAPKDDHLDRGDWMGIAATAAVVLTLLALCFARPAWASGAQPTAAHTTPGVSCQR